MYFTGSKTFWKNLEMWKFWSFLKMLKILQSAKLCWGVWRSDIFPQTQNYKQEGDRSLCAPFQFRFHRTNISRDIFFSPSLESQNIKDFKNILSKNRCQDSSCVFGVLQFCRVKSYSKGVQTNCSAILSWHSHVFKCCRFPKHFNWVKVIDLKSVGHKSVKYSF